MKTYSHYIIALFLSGGMTTTLTAQAQDRGYNGEIAVTAAQLRQQGDSLHIGLTLDATRLQMKSRHTLTLTPVLVSTTATKKSLSLPSVELKGRNNYYSYKRRLALMNASQYKAYKATAPMAVYKAYGKQAQSTHDYQLTVPFEAWMETARMELREEGCGCNRMPEELGTQPIAARMDMEPKVIIAPRPVVVYTRPAVEEVKVRQENVDVALMFNVGRMELNPTLGNNPAELQKIEKLMADLRADKSLTLKGARIAGYASPEGSLDLNKRLSEGRAGTLKNYLAGKFDMPASFYSVTFGGENWDGLVSALTTGGHDVAYKDEVMAILQSLSVEQGRETRLMALRGGAPYKQLLKEVFPSLRIAKCRIDFIVKPFFDVNEAKEVMKTQPGRLSLEEMYRVADTYPTGSEEFLELFDVAVRLFPTDETANLNAAAAAIERKDAAAAQYFLNRVKSRVRIPALDNNRGALLMLKGDYEQARNHLEAAAATGLKEAVENLKRLPAPGVKVLRE